ncbi:hypothetical protein KB874_07025 [Aestuariicoccus sp. KMU-90]|uniref:DUF6455 domain-containing protein n=2 Tax=Thetidibacter halocola TaxID=2827239 RepID=A0A8J8B6D1_9RHOB|nr:hypothetical protein [Thetidibacter halocola]
MASAQGIDLEEQILRGHFSISDLEDAVLRCTGCAAPEACEHWLAAQEGVAAATPDYCRNAALFAELARQG